MSQVLLCIDDRSEMLRMRKDNLERLGFSVVTATDSASALEILGKMDVAAVLLDYKMEGLDAEAVAFHIRNRYPNEPLLLLSAYSDMPERVLWLVDEYVMKSEPPELLVELVERVMNRVKQRGRNAAA